MNRYQEQNWQTHKNDALDHALDAALVRYSAIEARTGLEDRILANLRAEHVHAHPRSSWRWGVAAACATVVLVIIGLAWEGIRRAPTIAIHPPVIEPQIELPAPQIASTRPPAPYSMARPAPYRSKQTASANPKLDQFPSPQPLSEQEKILAGYVDAYPDHAVLLARARTEALRRDQIEETRSNSANEWAPVPEDQENSKTER